MAQRNYFSPETFPKDITAGLVVFLVALPLCLGVSIASNCPVISGVLAGIIGGIVVGVISKSHTSVSGPSASSPAIVAAQIAMLGSFEAFLAAVAIAGAIQIALGVGKMGFLSDFVPTSVIKGLLAAIGIILILKQIPHLLGHDPDPDGDMSFFQPDNENTFSELLAAAGSFEWGAAIIGLACLAVLIAWDRIKALKTSPVPVLLVVVVVGVGISEVFKVVGEPWAIDTSHLVDVPIAKSFDELLGFLTPMDFSALARPAVWQAGFVLALVMSLETLLNLEAVDRLDPYGRTSPTNRELIAQGVGNLLAGFVGGIPITSVIVRSSVNIQAGSRTRVATIVHGLLLLGAVGFLPTWLNRIPLSCLAAILLMTGFKLATPDLFRTMWKSGWNQFLPFVITVVAIVFTNLLAGVIIGLMVAIAFILWSNVNRPLHRIVERHVGGEVLHLELANQVSFLNRAAIAKVLESVPDGGHILIDARASDYIDPDILELIHDFERKTAPPRKIEVSLKGFQERYQMEDRIQFVDYSTRDLQRKLTPPQVLQILKDGNKRFIEGRRLSRDLGRQLTATAEGQFPLAVILSCIDSRSPAEIVFDLGVGDVFSIRIAGNVAKEKVLGSMEYACAVAGSKLILVLGHSRCGAVTAAVELAISGQSVGEATGCTNLTSVVAEIQKLIDGFPLVNTQHAMSELVEEVILRNILRVIDTIRRDSPALAAMEREGRIAIVGAKYDVASGKIHFLPTPEMLDVLATRY